MFNSRTDLILNEIKNNLDKSNAEIARIVVKKHSKEFSGWELESVRKRVSKVRIKNKFNNDTNERNKLDNKLASEFSEKDLEKIESYMESGNNAVLEKITNEKVQSLDDLIRICKINTEIWNIDKYEQSAYQVPMRLRQYNQKNERTADIKDVEQLYRVKAYLSRKVEELQLKSLKDEMIEEMKKYAPVYKKIEYKIDKKEKDNAVLMEIFIPDLHLGKFGWALEVGADYDLNIASQLYIDCVDTLLERVKGYKIDRFLLPVGNDFFNSNDSFNMTANGTPQDEDTRWQKTFRKGKDILIQVIDKLQLIAPVDVKVIVGNHDETRMAYLGEVLVAFYHNCPNVTIDNSPMLRKYYQYGKNLIGFDHGKDVKINDLAILMATEATKKFADTKYREWHLGHVHTQKTFLTLTTDESKGIVIRYIRSLTTPDLWHYRHGYINNIRAGESFLWHKEVGLIGQFSANL